MPQASTARVIKAAFVARLKARPALANVNVLPYIPVHQDDMRTRVGTLEVIAMAESAATYDEVVFCGSDLRFDETRQQTILIEVHGTDSTDGTQDAVDQRVDELLYEVQRDMANQRAWDFAAVGLDVFDYCYFGPAADRRMPGRLQQTSVFAAACELIVEIRSRRSFP